jgi:molybdopterin-containing oxidoreductase family membrane subunit
MSAKSYVMALFRTEDQAAEAIEAIKGSPWKLHSAHSPFQSHKITEALELKKSKVGYYTLAGGFLGFISGFALAIFTATRWDLIIGGKPIVALIPFVIVGFEFTILFSILGNIIGLMVFTGLPKLVDFNAYDIRCSGESFGIIACCTEGEEKNLADFLRKREGEARILDRAPKR